MSEVVNLPVWKKGATAYERLSELALLAKQHPERFTKFAIVYHEDLSNNKVKIRTFTHLEGGLTLSAVETMGMFSLANFHEYKEWTT